MNEFKISESCVKQRRYLFMVFPIIILVAAAFALFVSEYKVDDVMIPLGLVIIAAFLFMALRTKFIFKGMRNIKVCVYDDRIVKELGKHQQAVPWNSIIQVKLSEDSKGAPIFIRLYQNNNKTIYLYGFDDMQTLYNFIKAKVPPSALIQVKRNQANFNDPSVPILAVIFLLVIMAMVAPKTLKTAAFYFSASFVITGCFVLIFRPLTKDSLSLKRFTIFEAIAGILLIAVGIGGFCVLSTIF